jgi:hypothetical protein
MNNITKKTAFGITGAAAAALLIAGAATPAMASDEYSSSKWKSYSSDSHNSSPVVVAPDVDLLGGGIANGDNLNGNHVGSGNEVNAPLLSGNETAVGNGNTSEVSDVVDAPVSDVVDSNVSDIIGDVTSDVSDIVDVDDILGDVSGWVNLEGMFED